MLVRPADLSNRNDRIRTCDLEFPKHARYQTTLHSARIYNRSFFINILSGFLKNWAFAALASQSDDDPNSTDNEENTGRLVGSAKRTQSFEYNFLNICYLWSSSGSAKRTLGRRLRRRLEPRLLAKFSWIDFQKINLASAEACFSKFLS